MRGLTCLVMLMLAAASPAAAKTYNGMAFAGPTITGDSVVWGTEYSDGTGAVKVDGRIVARFERMTGQGERRQFGGVPGALSASPTRMAYALDESRPVGGSDGDSGAHEAYVVPFLSVNGAPFTNPFGCTGSYRQHGRSKVTPWRSPSTAPRPAPVCTSMDAESSDARPTSRQVRLAGPYVAWEECAGRRPAWRSPSPTPRPEPSSGASRLRRNNRWGEFDIDERGNVVTSLRGRWSTFSLADPRPRAIAKKTWGRVAIAGGRVAYVSLDKNSGPERLMLVDLDGKVLRALDRYGKRRWPEGEIALTDRWVAWSVKRATYDEPTGPGNVFFKRL